MTYYGFRGTEGIHRSLETAARRAAREGLTVADLYAMEEGRIRETVRWERGEFEIFLSEHI